MSPSIDGGTGTDFTPGSPEDPKSMMQAAGQNASDIAAAMIYFLTIFFIPLFAALAIKRYSRAMRLLSEIGLNSRDETMIAFSKSQVKSMWFFICAVLPCNILAVAFWNMLPVVAILFVPSVVMLWTIKPVKAFAGFFLAFTDETKETGHTGVKQLQSVPFFLIAAYWFHYFMFLLLHAILGPSMGASTFFVLLLNPFSLLCWIETMLGVYNLGQALMEAASELGTE